MIPSAIHRAAVLADNHLPPRPVKTLSLGGSGVAPSDKASTGLGGRYYAKPAALPVAVSRAAGQLFWLVFNKFGGRERVTTEEVRKKLGSRGNSDWLLYRDDDYCVCLEMPPIGADDEARIASVVAQLEEIAQLIDPDGPTYPVATGAQ